MAKKTDGAAEAQTKKNKVEGVLPSGMKVVITQGTGNDVMKARRAANGGESTTCFLIAELSTFNGKKLPAEEVLNFEIPDYLELEQLWGDFMQQGKSPDPAK